MTVICTCPTCGRPIEDARVPITALADLPMGPTSRALVAALAEAYPRALPMGRLIARVWADDVDGGPLNPTNTLIVTMRNVRPKLTRVGWTIRRPGQGSHAGYRLAPVGG